MPIRVAMIALLAVCVGCSRNGDGQPPAGSSTEVSSLSIVGSWVSEYAEKVYDLPKYYISFNEDRTFQAKAMGGWGQEVWITGHYVERELVLTLTCTATDKRTHKTMAFDKRLKIVGDQLEEITEGNLHLIFKRSDKHWEF